MPQQVVRLGLLIAAAVATLVGARSFLVPETFGELGHYRADAVKSVAARPMKFAGRQACADCHDEVGNTLATGNHRGLSCEVCHGPAALHVENPDTLKPPAPRDREFCPRCHAYDPSRPTGFPQVDPATHQPLTPCINCHKAHAPVPPRTPQECSACHGQIARQKILSRHVDLPCTTCHQGVPELHKVSPRAARPAKPTDRAFCARCHAKDAPRPAAIPTAREIPHVDVATHGGRYLCWQCHYPHYPEK